MPRGKKNPAPVDPAAAAAPPPPPSAGAQLTPAEQIIITQLTTAFVNGLPDAAVAPLIQATGEDKQQVLARLQQQGRIGVSGNGCWYHNPGWTPPQQQAPSAPPPSGPPPSSPPPSGPPAAAAPPAKAASKASTDEDEIEDVSEILIEEVRKQTSLLEKILAVVSAQTPSLMPPAPALPPPGMTAGPSPANNYGFPMPEVPGAGVPPPAPQVPGMPPMPPPPGAPGGHPGYGGGVPGYPQQQQQAWTPGQTMPPGPGYPQQPGAAPTTPPGYPPGYAPNGVPGGWPPR
jgi:hypothetical protein